MTEQASLVVLGGSAAGGNTGAGCAGFLLHVGDSTIALDLGPGTFLELRKHTNYRDLAGIVISHMHLDHIHDLAAMRYALSYSPCPADRRIPLWLPPGGKEALERSSSGYAGEPDQGFFDHVFDVTEYDPASILAAGSFRIRFTATIHFLSCWAMRVGSELLSEEVGYTADTGPMPELDEFLSGVTSLISEATWLQHPTPLEISRHMTAGEAGVLATRTGASTLILAHWWEELGEENYLEAARMEFNGNIHIAKPGLRVPLA